MEFLLVLGLAALSLLPRLALIAFKGFGIFHADHAVFGLMAKHILEGRPMIYYYGQGYMGSLDSFMAAFLFLIGGMNLFVLQLAPTAFYVLFILINYFLLKRVFGFEVSLIANLLLALSPPSLTLMSPTLGCYPETFFLGSLMLWSFVGYLESKRPLTLFSSGLVAGIALWVNNLVLLYFFAVGILFFLGSEFWRTGAPSSRWRNLFLLEGIGLPRFLRLAGIGIHLFVLFYILRNLASLFTKETLTLGPLHVKMASPAFHVKRIKKILWVLFSEAAVLYLCKQGIKKGFKNIKPALPLIGGFLLGTLPMILYSLAGGEGYRMIHGSGMIPASEFLMQFRSVVWEGFVNGVLGVPIEFLFQGSAWQRLRAWLILALSIALFALFLFQHRKEAGKLFQLQPGRYSFQMFPLLLIVLFLVICFFNNLRSQRYLLPSYFGAAVIFALSLQELRRRFGKAVGLILLLLLANNGYANFELIQRAPAHEEIKRQHNAILHFLESRQIRGAYAHFVTSYIMTFEAREKIIVAPYRSPDRYPRYTELVDHLNRVAYILEDGIQDVASFEKLIREAEVRYEKFRFAPFWVFLIDRSKRFEKGVV